MGFCVAHHQALAEDEVLMMRGIIDKFSQAVESSKSSLGGASKPELLSG